MYAFFQLNLQPIMNPDSHVRTIAESTWKNEIKKSDYNWLSSDYDA